MVIIIKVNIIVIKLMSEWFSIFIYYGGIYRIIHMGGKLGSQGLDYSRCYLSALYPLFYETISSHFAVTQLSLCDLRWGGVHLPLMSHLVSLSLDSPLSSEEQCTQVLTDHLVTWTTWAELWRRKWDSSEIRGPFGTLVGGWQPEMVICLCWPQLIS